MLFLSYLYQQRDHKEFFIVLMYAYCSSGLTNSPNKWLRSGHEPGATVA